MAIIVVYQPHQNIRQHEKIIQTGYQTCFQNADLVYWLPTFLSRENDLQVLNPNEILKLSQIDQIQNQNGQNKFVVAKLDELLAQNLEKHRQNRDLIIFMGAGNVDKWARQNLDKLTKGKSQSQI